MQEQPELVGRRSGAGGAVGGKMSLPRLDVVLGRAAPAVEVRVERLDLATGKVGDDEADVGTLGADLDAGDDVLDAASTGGPIQELLEAADLVRLRRRFKARQRAGFQIRDMLAQGCGGRHAEDEVNIVGAAPVDDRRTAIVAVGPDQDPGVWPIAADRPHQAAHVRADFCPARPLGRSQHRTDEPAVAIEHHDRLEAVLVVMGVEQTKLLAAVHGVKGVVDVEHDPLRYLPEGSAIEIDHCPPHRDQFPHAGQVLQPAHCRLRRQIPTRRGRVLSHLEDRIGAQPVSVIAVLIAGGDHLHAKADHVGQAVDDLVRAARIVDAARQTVGHTQPLFHFGQSQNAAVGRQHAAVETGDDGLAADR